MNYSRLAFCVIVLCGIVFAQYGSDSGVLSNNTSAVRALRGSQPIGNVSKISIRSLLYSGATTKIFVRYMPWFGGGSHIDVGYRSDDERQVSRQVDDMVSRGLDGAIVDWYGPADKFKNRSTELLLNASERRGLLMAVSVDKGTLKDCKKSCDETSTLIDAIQWALDHYGKSPAYWRVNGRPVVAFFGLEKSPIDWRRVRRLIHGNPLFLFRNSGGFKAAESDGAYAWITPEAATERDPYSLDYLNRFYKTANDYPDKFVMGSAYFGFDDSLAGWGKGRRIDSNCGDAWLQTFAVVNQHYSSSHQLPALIIPTWNDYEEGTAIESGIDNCVQVQAHIEGGHLQWTASGHSETVDHFEVLSVRENQIERLAVIPANKREFDVSAIRPGTQLQVVAVGRPSMTNQVSNPVKIVRVEH